MTWCMWCIVWCSVHHRAVMWCDLMCCAMPCCAVLCCAVLCNMQSVVQRSSVQPLFCGAARLIVWCSQYIIVTCLHHCLINITNSLLSVCLCSMIISMSYWIVPLYMSLSVMTLCTKTCSMVSIRAYSIPRGKHR